MTPARKAALQWFHDRGEVEWIHATNRTSVQMISRMEKDGEIECHGGNRYSLTPLGRRRLHGDDV